MDSFYDQPRNVPKPTNINKLTTPIIPEVSLLQPPIANTDRIFRPQPAPLTSYTAWKSRNPINKENFSPYKEKHVRFESPRNGFDAGVKSKTLEELYRANLPNKNLDLSVIETGTNKKENCYDIFNYKRNDDDFLRVLKCNEEIDEKPQKSYGDYKRFQTYKESRFNYYDDPLINSRGKELIKKPEQVEKIIKDDEPTTRDLLKVIQQQNEQILLLQKQVACLLESNQNNQKQIEPPLRIGSSDEDLYKKPKKGPLSKIAIDVMTSFEVSFRPQNQNLPRNKLREIEDSLKIEEIVDDGGAKNVLDGIKKIDKNKNKFDVGEEEEEEVSLSLREPLKVVERCPSPEQSVHVDMQDYSSDEEDAESDLGWTLYNNIMGQVNNIFKNAESNPKEPPQCNKGGVKEIKDKTLRRVKEATMKHLKNIGVNLPLIDEKDVSKDTKTSDDFSESDVSFAVKQLLMKYLPDEQLAKLSNNKKDELAENAIKRRPEFSFASIQYMKKYNLLASSGEVLDRNPQNVRQTSSKDAKSQKILDVTALKQQPKLL